MTPTLATRFARNTFVARRDTPLAEDQMRQAAPSIFAAGKHDSRSERYTCIPTIDVLRGLRREGFELFMVAQSRCRTEGKTEYTKHMIRMRHAGFMRNGRGAHDTMGLRAMTVADALFRPPGAAQSLCVDDMTSHSANRRERAFRSKTQWPCGSNMSM